jgi:hypothetical protein
MTYVPVKIVTQIGSTLKESTDLTVTLESVRYGTHFLVVEKLERYYTLNLALIFLRETGIVMTHPVSTGLTTLLDDQFVTKYLVDYIPSINSKGAYNKRLSVLNPISDKRYEVDYTLLETPTIRNDNQLKGSLDDLVISSTKDLSNSLVVVNGVFHRTILHQDELFVVDGFRTMRVSAHKDVTLIDTTELGGHTCIPITESMVTIDQYNGLATIDAGVSIDGKTVLIVIDGYLYHMESNVLIPLGGRFLSLHTNRLDLVRQFRNNPRTLLHKDILRDVPAQDSRRYDDAFDDIFISNPIGVPLGTLENVGFVKSRIAHYHSFLIVINNDSVFSVATDVHPDAVKGVYKHFASSFLSGVVNLGCGLCPSYLIYEEDGGFREVMVDDTHRDYDSYRSIRNPNYISPPKFVEDSVFSKVRFIDYVSA